MRYRVNSLVTRKEILFSVIIVCFSLIIGLAIKSKIDNNIMETNQVYYSALKINDNETEFSHVVNTQYGNVLAYGEFSTDNPVSHNHISGEYSYIYRTKEEYTQHTRTVTYTDSDGKTKTKTETYYSWDYVGSNSWTADSLQFLGFTYDGGIFDYPTSYLTTKYTSGTTRYNYYVTPLRFKGSILVNYTTGEIKAALGNKNIPIFNGNIEETITNREKAEFRSSIIFWCI